MKKVLITGASGFIGRHCLPLLSNKGYKVHAVSRGNSFPEKNERWHQTDLLNADEVTNLINTVKPTHLLHFAWYVEPKEYWTSPKNIEWLNASIHLIREFARAGGKRVVAAGSCAEYDWAYQKLSETTPCKPATLYGLCKNALQQEIKRIAAGERNLSYAWGRIFFPYGPYDHPEKLVSYVVHSLINGQIARCTHGNQIRDFIYVKDAADAFATLLESDFSGPVNIASGNAVTLKEIIGKIAQILNGNDLIQLDSLPVRKEEPHTLRADIHLLSNKLKWRPKYNLDSGLSEVISMEKEPYDH